MQEDIICTACPIGCRLKVNVATKTVIENKCPRGEIYGLQEAIHPVRLVTSTVRIENAKEKLLPVKTDKPIDKSLVFECIKILNKITVVAPIRLGDVLVENILDSGAYIVATKSICAK